MCSFSSEGTEAEFREEEPVVNNEPALGRTLPAVDCLWVPFQFLQLVYDFTPSQNQLKVESETNNVRI